MRSQRCTQCGTRLDVSRMEHGAKFTCSNCNAVLVVGDVPVTKKSLSESGPQFKPRKKEDKGATVPSRSRRAREGAPASPARSKKPLLIGGAVVAVIAIVVIAMNMGGSGGGFGGIGGSGPSPSAKWWADTQAQLASLDADGIRTAIRQAKQNGYDSNPAFWSPKADELYKALLAKAPDDAEANRFYGRAALQSIDGFAALWAGMEKHQARMPDEYVRFFEKYLPAQEGGKRVWMGEEEHARAQDLLSSFSAWFEKAEADPTPELIEKGRMRAQALTAGFGSVPAVELPFITFLGSRELDKSAEKSVRDAKAAAFAPRIERVKKRVAAVKKAWTEQIAKPLGLPGYPTDKALYLFCFDNREAFAQMAAREGRGLDLDVGSSLLFFYRTADPVAFGLIPATPEEDKWFAPDLGHIVVHMLQKEYSKDPKDKWGKPMDEWNGLWLVEGLAEYVGAGCRDDGSFTGVSPKRADFLKQADVAGVLFFSIRDIVRFSSYQTYLRYMRDSYWPEFHADRNAPESVAAFVSGVGGQGFFSRPAFQAQCWYLCYFLNHYENGKYKAKFQQIVKAMLQGRRNDATGERYGSSEDAFAKIMGLAGEADWTRLQTQYDDFLPKAVGSE
jgi:hypothetical protein